MTTMIIIGGAVQLLTLMGAIFAGGRFTGRITTQVDRLRYDVIELKSDIKELRNRN